MASSSQPAVGVPTSRGPPRAAVACCAMTSLPAATADRRDRPLPSGSPLVARTPRSRTRARCWRCCPPYRRPTTCARGCAAARASSAGAARPAVHGIGPGPVRRAESWWSDLVAHAVVRDEVARPGTGPVAFGSVSFAADSAEGDARRARGRRRPARRRWWLTTIGASTRTSRPIPVPAVRRPPADAPADVAFADGALSPADWAAGRGRGRRADHRGRARQGRARPRPRGHAAAPIDVRWLLHRLAERYDTHLGVRRRRAGRGHARAARAAREGPRHLAGARRHHPAHRRRRRTTSRSRPPSRARARTSRSTSTPCARSPTPSRRTARR